MGKDRKIQEFFVPLQSMSKEFVKYVIIPLVHDELHGNIFRVGCHKLIDDSLCNFVGVTIGSKKITEYSYAKYGTSLNPRAKEISVDKYNFITDSLKHIYSTVNGLINFAPDDETSDCYYMKNGGTIYLINGSPNSDWNNFVLIKREIPNIIIPNDVMLASAFASLDKKKIQEFLFFEIMDYIQDSLTLITRLVKTYYN